MPDKKIETVEDYKTYISSKTIVSKSKVKGDGGVAMFYFWATFSDAGMKYGMSDSDQEKAKYDANNDVYLTGSFMANNVATFTGGANNQKGKIEFELDDKGEIINIRVTIESGTAGGNNTNPGNASTGFDGVSIDCKLVKENI